MTGRTFEPLALRLTLSRIGGASASESSADETVRMAFDQPLSTPAGLSSDASHLHHRHEGGSANSPAAGEGVGRHKREGERQRGYYMLHRCAKKGTTAVTILMSDVPTKKTGAAMWGAVIVCWGRGGCYCHGCLLNEGVLFVVMVVCEIKNFRSFHRARAPLLTHIAEPTLKEIVAYCFPHLSLSSRKRPSKMRNRVSSPLPVRGVGGRLGLSVCT